MHFPEKTICISPPFVYKPASQAPAKPVSPLLGNSSTVERRTLTPLILVRIQVPQPILLKSPEFLASGNKLFRFMLQYGPMRGTHDLTASYDKY